MLQILYLLHGGKESLQAAASHLIVHSMARHQISPMQLVRKDLHFYWTPLHHSFLSSQILFFLYLYDFNLSRCDEI